MTSVDLKRNSAYQKLHEKKAEKARLKGLNDKAKENTRSAKIYKKNKEILEKKLDDVSKGKTRAGKDFIIQRDVLFDSILLRIIRVLMLL